MIQPESSHLRGYATGVEPAKAWATATCRTVWLRTPERADDGFRTRGLDHGKVALCQLSYIRKLN